MGDMLVIVEKSYGGEIWANTHCLRMNATGGTVNDADMTALGIGTPITAANTASGGAVNPITRLLSFERLMHRTLITISRVYVTDGKRNSFTDPDYAWATSLSLAGLLAAPTAPTDLAPGNIALVVNRVPLGFNSRAGRMFIRGNLLDGDIRFNMRGGVDFTDATYAGFSANNVATAVTGSGIGTMFNGGTNAGVALYSIPHYLSAKLEPDPKKAGALVNSTPVVSLVVSAPRSRQMLRGKKRKAATTVVV